MSRKNKKHHRHGKPHPSRNRQGWAAPATPEQATPVASNTAHPAAPESPSGGLPMAATPSPAPDTPRLEPVSTMPLPPRPPQPEPEKRATESSLREEIAGGGPRNSEGWAPRAGEEPGIGGFTSSLENVPATQRKAMPAGGSGDEAVPSTSPRPTAGCSRQTVETPEAVSLTLFTPTRAQLRLLHAFCSPDIVKGRFPNLRQLCLQADVPRATFYRWLKNPAFRQWLSREAREFVISMQPYALLLRSEPPSPPCGRKSQVEGREIPKGGPLARGRSPASAASRSHWRTCQRPNGKQCQRAAQETRPCLLNGLAFEHNDRNLLRFVISSSSPLHPAAAMINAAGLAASMSENQPFSLVEELRMEAAERAEEDALRERMQAEQEREAAQQQSQPPSPMSSAMKRCAASLSELIVASSAAEAVAEAPSPAPAGQQQAARARASGL